ncbi:MAG: hypothetical protein ACRDRO_28050 [Pseudonocardiaceae bacterium]
MGGPVDSVAVRLLWSVTPGNALYLRQLVDGELGSNRLHQVVEVWRWSGERRRTASGRVRQLAEAKLAATMLVDQGG